MNFFFQRKIELLALDISKSTLSFTALEINKQLVRIKGFDSQHTASLFLDTTVFNPTALCAKMSSFIKDHNLSQPLLAISLADYASFESLEPIATQEREKQLAGYACFSLSIITDKKSHEYQGGIAQSLLMQLHCVASRIALDLVAVTTRSMAYYTLLMHINPSWRACFDEDMKSVTEYFYEQAHQAITTNNLIEKIDNTKKLEWQLLLSSLGLYYLGKDYEAP